MILLPEGVLTGEALSLWRASAGSRARHRALRRRFLVSGRSLWSHLQSVAVASLLLVLLLLIELSIFYLH